METPSETKEEVKDRLHLISNFKFQAYCIAKMATFPIVSGCCFSLKH